MRNQWLITLLLLPNLGFAAGQIERIESEDGVVEFSNVKQKTTKKPVKTTLIYQYSESDDVVTFSNTKPKHIDEFIVLKYDCYACNPDSTINWHQVSLNLTSYANLVHKTAQDYHVDPALIRAIMHAESAFNPNALSHKGAEGLMQLMPATARELGVDNARDPAQNIMGGAKYLAQLLRDFKNDIQLAAAAYNAGPGAVRKYDGIPPYKETQVYVERVRILHQRYQKALNS